MCALLCSRVSATEPAGQLVSTRREMVPRKAQHFMFSSFMFNACLAYMIRLEDLTPVLVRVISRMNAYVDAYVVTCQARPNP